jgi:hypothetical protein
MAAKAGPWSSYPVLSPEVTRWVIPQLQALDLHQNRVRVERFGVRMARNLPGMSQQRSRARVTIGDMHALSVQRCSS